MSTAVNIGIFGRRNVGKSSLINTLAGQEVAIVSDHPGTTTDPVRKRMEIFGLGPCVLIDTAGIDDDGSLGRMRVARTEEVTAQIDIALLLFSASDFGKPEEDLMDTLTRYSVPVVLIHSKSDISSVDSRLKDRLLQKYPDAGFQDFSSSAGIPEKDSMVQSLLETVRRLVSSSRMVERPMFDGIVSAGQRVLLVCPIDSEAPTGRLILPQVNAIRSLLDIGAVATVVQPVALARLFPGKGEHFDLVVTDSQRPQFRRRSL